MPSKQGCQHSAKTQYEIVSVDSQGVLLYGVCHSCGMTGTMFADTSAFEWTLETTD